MSSTPTSTSRHTGHESRSRLNKGLINKLVKTSVTCRIHLHVKHLTLSHATSRHRAGTDSGWLFVTRGYLQTEADVNSEFWGASSPLCVELIGRGNSVKNTTITTITQEHPTPTYEHIVPHPHPQSRIPLKNPHTHAHNHTSIYLHKLMYRITQRWWDLNITTRFRQICNTL